MGNVFVSTFVRLGSLAIFSFAVSAFGQASFVDGELIVKYRNHGGVSTSRSAIGFARRAVSNNMTIKAHFEELSMYHVALPDGKDVNQAIRDLKNDPDVEYAEPNYIIKKASVSGVEQEYSAEELQMASSSQVMSTGADIGLNQMYQRSSGQVSSLSARPIVAVIDTGLDLTHSVITGTNAVWTNPGEIANNQIDDDGNGFVDDVHGWNFVAGSGTMYDDDGHGTHVTGIVLSVDQNIFAPSLHTSKVQIMPLKFLDSTGSGSTSNAIRAIYYAVQNGAVVLNNSWGGSDYSSALNEAIAYSYNAGAVFVAAAGNAGLNNDSSPMYPANYNVPNIISVAAITDSDSLASFSDFGGNSVHIGSPGVWILSTLPGNRYGSMSGTSMATPFVSGTAAQMKVSSPNMLGYQVRTLIMGQATDVTSLHQKVISNGKLNSVNSVNTASTASVDRSQPAYQMSYQADRTLASNLSGGGCGLVANMDDQDGPPTTGLRGIIVTLALIVAPLAFLVYRGTRSPANRRRYERFRINSEVRIAVGDKELVGSVSSISLGGVQVNTNALLKDGGLVTLSIASPDGTERVEVAGRVVWSEANKAYGVAFAEAPQSILSRIGQWTQALQKA